MHSKGNLTPVKAGHYLNELEMFGRHAALYGP